MKTRHIGLLAASSALVLVAGIAPTRTLHGLEGQHVEKVYGTYAPTGDCNRAPRVIVDDRGFTFQTAHGTSHPDSLGYNSGDYRGAEAGVMFDFYAFVAGNGALPPVLMTFDTEQHGLVIENPAHRPMTPLQTALVHGSPYVRCSAHTTSAH